MDGAIQVAECAACTTTKASPRDDLLWLLARAARCLRPHPDAVILASEVDDIVDAIDERVPRRMIEAADRWHDDLHKAAYAAAGIPWRERTGRDLALALSEPKGGA